ncbi:MAG: glycosyltransferase [Ectothiorhodospiraceae bacterium]|nr:glycosyltransferase [Ectothiorhodospiraceae bacterium]
MKHDLIVFAEDWGGLPSSTQHLISHLAKQRKVVWVNSIGLRRPTFGWRDIKRALNKLRGNTLTRASASVMDIDTKTLPSDNFHIVYPRTLPAPRSRLGRWLAARLLISQIAPVVKKANLQSPILWTSLPTAVDVAGKLGDSALVYYCGDDFSALAGVDHDTVAEREKELSEKADLILSASENLAKKFPSSRSYLLPHGVDYSLFSEPAPRAADLPDDGRPVAGFYGSISEWFDIEMLQATIRQMSDWHFVFIGKPIIDVSALTAFDNVHLLGERAHHLLPSYSQHWTASLLPFVDNAQIQACNPLKLSEYLAAGRPIISTAFPAMQPYRGLLQVANNSDAMIEALRASQYVGNLPAFSAALRKAVSKHSWAARALQTNQWLEAL